MKLLGLILLFCLRQAAFSEKIINCYWDAWSYYRSGVGKFEPSFIDPKLCTHLSFGPYGFTKSGVYIREDVIEDLTKQCMALKKQNPKLKVLAVVGGWNLDSGIFNTMTNDYFSRSTFINESLRFIQKHKFDGMMLGWEHPTTADKANFILLLSKIKELFDQHGLELSVAINATAVNTAAKNSSESEYSFYNIPGICHFVNYINLMVFGDHIQNVDRLGHYATIPAVKQAVDYWIENGASADKIVLGVGAFGFVYQMVDLSTGIPGDKSIATSSAGPFTNRTGFLSYYEICNNNNWTYVFHLRDGVPYAKWGKQWIGYNNEFSLQLQMDVVSSRNLAGALMFNLDTDDFRGQCGLTYPLLNAINNALLNIGQDVGDNFCKKDGSTDGYHIVSNDCDGFYSCFGATRHKMHCPDGLNFDIRFLQLF